MKKLEPKLKSSKCRAESGNRPTTFRTDDFSEGEPIKKIKNNEGMNPEVETESFQSDTLLTEQWLLSFPCQTSTKS